MTVAVYQRPSPTGMCGKCGRADLAEDDFYASNASTCKQCLREARLARYSENREAEKQSMRDYASRTSEDRKRSQRRWANENPERYATSRRRRKMRRRAREAESFVEDVDAQVVWERDEGVCGICGLPADREDFHVDHVIPLARGGEHSYANVQVAHPLCNLSKGDKILVAVMCVAH